MDQRSYRPTLLIIFLLLPVLVAAVGPEEARSTALRFGRALTRAQASDLEEILPARGKIHLSLDRFGPEEGHFGGSQVIALFEDFLDNNSVRSFELLRLDCDSETYAMVQGRVVMIGKDGRRARVGLQLAFQPEEGNWVIREIRETAP